MFGVKLKFTVSPLFKEDIKMNFKKLIAAFSAGVISISALASVAVSAKEQKALNLSFNTMFDEEIVEGKVILQLAGDKWTDNKYIYFYDDDTFVNLYIKGVSHITYRDAGRSYSIKGSVIDLIDDTVKELNAVKLGPELPGGNSQSSVRITFYYMAKTKEIALGALTASGTGVEASNAAVKSTGKLEGFTINKPCREIAYYDYDDSNIVYCDVEKLYRSVREKPEAGFTRDINSAFRNYEDATITFVFDKDRKLPEDSTITDDYNWEKAMKSVSLVINDVDVQAKPEIKIGNDTCTVTYKWDDIKGQEKIFDSYSSIHTLVLKTNNGLLETKLTDKSEVMDLELISVDINAPEKTAKGETVEDFSAGAGCVVNETAL